MNIKYGLGQAISHLKNSKGESYQSPFTPVRVVDIILDNQHPDYVKLGDWNSIGFIKYRPVYSTHTETNPENYVYAQPFYPNLKYYPLKNEIVYVFSLPASTTQNNNTTINYYFYPINIWNSIHHNALPDISNPDNIPDNQRLDYKQTSAGAVRKIEDESSEINLGNTFQEKTDIHPLLPYEGDMIIEGRWGNSIRMGSTVFPANISNPWSNHGDNGNPIMIFRNGQPEDATSTGWVPVLEDINKDGSSIYMTKNQILPIVVASTNQKSFNQTISQRPVTTNPPDNISSLNSLADSDNIQDIPPVAAPTTSSAPTFTPTSSLSSSLVTEQDLIGLFPSDELSDPVDPQILEEVYFVPEETNTYPIPENLPKDVPEPEKIKPSGFIIPTVGVITSRNKERVNPITGKREIHGGIDIANKTGTPVYAVARGQVKRADYSKSYGNVVILYHPESNLYSLYAHLSSISTVVGTTVGQGIQIGKIGATGRATGPHLHFEFISIPSSVGFGTKEFYSKAYKQNPESYINFNVA